MSILKALNSEAGESKNNRYSKSIDETMIKISTFEFLYGKYLFWKKLYGYFSKKNSKKLKTPKWKPLIAKRWDTPSVEKDVCNSLFRGVAVYSAW